MLKKILALIALPIALVIATAIPAGAATASPGEWILNGNAAVIADEFGSGNIVRLPAAGTPNSYVYSLAVFSSLLTSHPNATLKVCATFRTNTNGESTVLQVSNGAWSVGLISSPNRTVTDTQCALVGNGSSQPLGGGVFADGNAGGPNVLLKNVTITIL